MNGFTKLLIDIGLSDKEADQISNQSPSSGNTILLASILVTLREMKQQEFDYWEAWKKAKTAEQQNPKGVEQE